jgi:hypothetical protein
MRRFWIQALTMQTAKVIKLQIHLGDT